MHLTKRGKRRLLILFAIVAVAVVAVAAVVVFRDVYRSRLAEKSRTAGLSAYEAGDYEAALLELQYPLQRDRQDLEVLLAFAESRQMVAEVNNRHLFQAANLYNEILRLDEDNRVAHERLLSIYGRLDFRTEAEEIADRLLQLDPEHIEALSVKYALLYGRLARGESVEEDPEQYARRLIALEPGRLNWYKFVLEAMRVRGDGPEAMLAQCDEWIEGNADDGDGRFLVLKAETLMGLRRYQESLETALVAAERGTDSLEVLDLMLSLFDVLSLHVGADDRIVDARISLLDRTLERHADKPWVYVAMIRQQWRSGDYAAAQDVLARAEEAIGDIDDELLRWKALLATAADDSDGALDAVRQLESRVDEAPDGQRDANRAWAQAMRARLTVEEQGWPAAIEGLQRALELNPRDPILQYMLGEAFQHIDEHELAARALTQAVRYDYLWVTPYLAVSRSLLALNRPDEALGVLFRLLERSPNVAVELYVLYAEAWIDAGHSVTQLGPILGQDGQRLSLLEMLNVLNEQTGGRNPKVVTLLMRALIAAGDEEGAAALVEDLLARDAASGPALLALAGIARQAGLDAGAQLLDQARATLGLTPEIAAAQAQVLREQGRTEEGLELLNRAFEEASDEQASRAARRQLVAYMAAIEHPDTLATMREMLEADPTSHEPALFVISTPMAWRDRSLIDDAIDRLDRTAGKHSPRVVLARATVVLRYESDDPAKLAAALSDVSQVLEMTPESLPALTLMAELLMAGDEPDPNEASRFLARAVDAYPTAWSLYPRLISLLQEQGDFDSANEYLRRFALRTDDVAGLRQAEFELLEKQGDYETLALRLRETLDESATVNERLVLANLYRRTGQLGLAWETYDRLLAMAPNDERVVGAAADFLADRGRREQAMTLLDSFEDPDHPAKAFLLRGRFHTRLGETEAAGAAYERAVELEPENPEAIDRLARLYIEAGAADRALPLIERGLSQNADDESLREARALALLQGDPDSRAEALRVIESLGESRRAWLETEQLNQRLRSREGPPTNRDLADVRRLVESHEAYLPAWRLAVAVHAAADLVPEAVQLARRAAANIPLSAEPMEWATTLLVQRSQPSDALASARQWRQRSLSNPFEVDVIIASLLLDLGRAEEAFEQLEPYEPRIERSADRHFEHLVTWLRALVQTGRLDRAEPFLAGSLAAREAWYALTRELDVPAAYEALDLAEQFRGDSAREAYLLGAEWARLGRRENRPAYLERAEQFAGLASADEMLAVPVIALRATIAVSREDYSAAESLYREALQRQPDNPGVLNNLAFLMLQRDPNSAEALTMTTRAVALAPDSPDLLDTHALALLGADRVDEASSFAERAIVLNEDDAGFRLTLATVRIAQQRIDDAVRQLDAARRMLESMPRRDEALWERLQMLQRRIEDQTASAS